MTDAFVEEHAQRQFNKDLVCMKDEVITQFEALTVDVGKTYEGNNSANITDLITSGKDMLLTTETQCLDTVNNSTLATVFPDCKEAYFPNKDEVIWCYYITALLYITFTMSQYTTDKQHILLLITSSM